MNLFGLFLSLHHTISTFNSEKDTILKRHVINIVEKGEKLVQKCCGKEETACNEQFLLSQLWTGLNFVDILIIGHRLTHNPFPHNDTCWRPLETSFLKTM